MIRLEAIFKYILSLVISLLSPVAISAQTPANVAEPIEQDSTSFLHGFAVGIDLVGIVQYAVSDYGQFEATLRLNLHDKYFPIFEAGIGRASSDDEVTEISYRSTAPYFRIGADYNMMKNKHDDYRIYLGGRYAFSYFNYDVSHPDMKDPYYGGISTYMANDVKCYSHWLELAAGVDAKIWGPFHLGWSVRYRKRLFHDSGELGNVWYVPGFGKDDSSNLGAAFYFTIDI